MDNRFPEDNERTQAIGLDGSDFVSEEERTSALDMGQLRGETLFSLDEQIPQLQAVWHTEYALVYKNEFQRAGIDPNSDAATKFTTTFIDELEKSFATGRPESLTAANELRSIVLDRVIRSLKARGRRQEVRYMTQLGITAIAASEDLEALGAPTLFERYASLFEPEAQAELRAEIDNKKHGIPGLMSTYPDSTIQQHWELLQLQVIFEYFEETELAGKGCNPVVGTLAWVFKQYIGIQYGMRLSKLDNSQTR